MGERLPAEYVLTPLRHRMAEALVFMPELDRLTVGVIREIIERCYRAALEFGAQDDGIGADERQG